MRLDDIVVRQMQRIETTGGDVLHAMKQSDPGYAGFGEAYFSWVISNAVKAWKRHTRMTMNVVVPVGRVKFVFCLIKDDGTKEFRVEETGEDCYTRITIPPGIWFGFQGLHMPQSLVLNVADIPHDPSEIERLGRIDIDYIWS
jgi:dTDP-4-dehydrorhamnose 3,5-epimerase